MRKKCGFIAKVVVLLLLILDFIIHFRETEVYMKDLAANGKTSNLIPVDESDASTASNNTVLYSCPKGMVFMQDLYRTGTATPDTTRLIPNVMYQTSKSRCIHAVIARVMKKWRNPAIFPDLSHRFYDDDAMNQFLYDERWKDEFPTLPLVLKCIKNVPVMKADIWRLLVIWEYGGIYVDLDTAPTSLFNGTTIRPDDDAFFCIEGLGVATQYFFAASPRHPMIYYAIHSALKNVLLSRRPLPAQQTGPRAIVHGHALFMNKTLGIAYSLVEGKMIGKDGRSIRIAGERPPVGRKQYIIRDAVPMKKKHYKNMNMTHFHENRGKKYNGGSCLAHVGGTIVTSNDKVTAMYQGKEIVFYNILV